MTRTYDLVVFGASGFTGKYVVEEIAKLLSDKKAERFTWAVAGRSSSKLTEVLKEASEVTGYDVNSIDKILVDITKPKTINDMAKQAFVVLNCVGPYRFYGEDVIKACIAEGTHHVDISGEPQFLEGMQLKYHKEAKEKGVYIVGACGFDSIPADLGVMFLKAKFNGDVNSVETYLELQSMGSSLGQASIHYGTWLSAIHGLAHMNELRPIREQLFPDRLPKPTFKLTQRSVLHKNEIVNGWCLPFLGSDKSIIQRTERYFFEEEKRQAVQVQTYMKQSSFIGALFLMMGALFFGVMTQFKVGRYLLATFPRLFSLGMVSHEGPTRERANVPFSFTISGEGWTTKLDDPTARHSEAPNKKMIVKVRGINPGYGATCIAMIHSGLTILRETDKLPSKGGVYTTGVAFAKTNIVENLHKSGLTFDVEHTSTK